MGEEGVWTKHERVMENLSAPLFVLAYRVFCYFSRASREDVDALKGELRRHVGGAPIRLHSASEMSDAHVCFGVGDPGTTCCVVIRRNGDVLRIQDDALAAAPKACSSVYVT